ncbi:MAG: hypothetical protein WCT22_04195 [Patescibacteria group bacterium]|jgi:hypothetical protein
MKSILQFAGILLVGAVIIILTTLVVNLVKEPAVVEKIVEKPVVLRAPECPENFEAYKKLMEGGHFVRLVDNQKSYASGGKFVGSRQIDVKKSGPGQIACGYLYVRAKIDGKSLDKKYDSVYINPQNFGGHILRSKTISISDPIPNTTETLLPLNSVSYLPNIPYNPDAQNYRLADWVKLLNVSDKINFQIGLSTQDHRGVIEDVSLVYKCWNPETGAENTDCQLSL